MKNNRAFWKAVHSLTHPLSVSAILLLLFNDHWLRYHYPSWLTGKLGDFTWLLFAPFIASLVLAWIIPHKHKHQTKLVGWLSIGFIGIWFATAKTILVIHWLTTETLALLVGYHGTLRMDVTDLLTLPALLISAYIWLNAREDSLNTKPIGYALFGLAMLGTLASDMPYFDNRAIEEICELEDAHLLTSYRTREYYYEYEDSPSHENTYNYISTDGGLTWQATDAFEADDAIRCSSPDDNIARNLQQTDIIYRWQADKYIDQSSDDGATWTRIHQLNELEQDVRELCNHSPYNSSSSPIPRYLPSPVSGLVHSETGNLVLAMSRDGVLVITPENTAHWVAVNGFQLDDLRSQELLSRATSLHHFLLPTLLLLIAVSTIVLIHSRKAFTHLGLIIGWIHWMLLVFGAHISFTGSDSMMGSTLLWGLSALFSMVVIALPMVLWAGYNLIARYGRATVPILVTCMVATLAYALPIAMWTQGLVPRYYVAAIFSLLLVGCVLASCYTYYKDKLPERYEVEKPKRKEKPKVSASV